MVEGLIVIGVPCLLLLLFGKPFTESDQEETQVYSPMSGGNIKRKYRIVKK